VFEIDKTHRGALSTGFPIFTDAGVFQLQVQDIPVILDQAGAGKAVIVQELLHLEEQREEILEQINLLKNQSSQVRS